MAFHIDMQCEIILQSSKALDDTVAALDREFAAMAQGRENPSFRGNTHAYWHLQSLLVAAGNISKALWGRDENRCALLRDTLQVSDQSSLANREVRNCFEHYEDRVAKWIDQNPGIPFSDCNMGPWCPPTKVFRHYNPVTKIVTGVGQDFKQHDVSVADIVAEVHRIVAANPFAYRPHHRREEPHASQPPVEDAVPSTPASGG